MYVLENRQVFHFSPDELVVHPKLIEIYGEIENRPSLLESIQRDMRIIVPLEISNRTGVKVVLAGKCRLQIAKQLGFATVPVMIRSYSSPEEEEDMTFLLNLSRDEKTHFQKFLEGERFEAMLRPEAKVRQQEGASYARQKILLLSNLTKADDATDSKDQSRINVRSSVAKSLKISAGSYSNGKKVYKYISELKEAGREFAAYALQQELDRSIDGAYKFISNDRRDKVLNLIEEGEVNTIREGLAMVGTGFRNPWRQYEVGQVYQFKKEPRPDYYRQARVTKITDEFVIFAFRNQKTHELENIGFRPSNINATLIDEPSVPERERINRLLEKFSHVYFIRRTLDDMLTNITNFTMDEERLLALYETGFYEQLLSERKLELEMMAMAKKTGDLCAA